MKPILTITAATAALGLAGAASAQQWPWPFGQSQQPYPPPYQQPYGQPYGDRSAITFYEFPNFGGRSVTVYGEENNFADIGFNDRARSARANGSFLVCEDLDFRGRCERVSGDVRDLGYFGLGGRVSSARIESGGWGGYPDDDYRPGGGYGSPGRERVEGRTAVFFATPRVNSSPVAARGQGSADQFCRAAGYGVAIYYSQGERDRRAVDQDGRLVDAPVLRDVLCRRR